MAETSMRLEDWLDDLCVRFIINLPREELESVERICFQVEEAQWFYEDFIRPLDPALPSLSLKAFALRIFQHCPLMSQWSHYHHITAFSEFLAYKTRVPVRGAIMLNHPMDEVVLVKGWKKGANWSFPRGKINKDEKDLDCAIREVYEETGFDIKEAGLVKEEKDMKYIEIAMREQHMRLYVFRGIPMDTKFEPRTRKEISKIEWYKLSDLPTLRKNKQHEEHLVTNANKFYMVAPFLNPLKKWIAQQKKNETKASNTTQPTHLVTRAGEFAVEGVGPGAPGKVIAPQQQVPTEVQMPSDLPEVSESQDASAHLKRLLNINGLMSVPQNAHVNEQKPSDPDPSKSNALLSLLRSGSNTGATNVQGQGQTQNPHSHLPHMPRPPQQYPVQTSATAPFGSLNQAPQPPMQQQAPSGRHPPVHPQHGPSVHMQHPGNAPNHIPRPNPPMFNQQQRFPQGPSASYPPHQPPPAMGHHGDQRIPQAPMSQQPRNVPFQQGPMPMTQQFAPPSRRQTPAPYQRTGDPEFAHASDAENVQMRSVPPANKLPPPKLTSHSLALLNVFKNGSPQPLKDGTPAKPATQGAQSSSPRTKTQHQGNLLDLLKGTSVSTAAGGQNAPRQAARAELAAQPTPSIKQAAVQHQQQYQGHKGAPSSQGYPPLMHESPKTRAGSGATTTATVSGPLNIPQFDQISKSSSKRPSNATTQKGPRDQKPQTPPVVILPRPNSGKKESIPTTQPVARPTIDSLTKKNKPSEPEKPFQIQILRRQDRPDLEKSLPTHTVTVSEFSKPGSEKPAPEPQKEPAKLTYDRRPSQPAAQKEALLSLFGKSSSPPARSASSATSHQFSPPTKSPVASTVISPVDKSNFGPDVQAAVDQATISRIGSISSTAESGVQTPNKAKVTSPTNKAFLLGFLDGVAKGNR